MDKYEYRVRAEQIKTLLEKHEYVEAMNVADTVDWRRVKSVSMLCTVSEIYKINRKYEESRDILLLAYERYPGGKMIVYALCELSIKMEEYVQAVEYMKEFVQVAPRDTGIYILRYKLYEAQEVPLEERIEVLEDFKKRDYRERWAYELAYLYHRVGLGTRCVEVCDELILWFGEGKYVTKAMELKMLHEPLTPEQQAKYERRNIAQAVPSEYEPKRPMDVVSEESLKAMRAAGDRLAVEQTNNLSQLFGQLPSDNAEVSQVINDNEFEVKPVNMSKYSTMNLQAELAKSMQEFLVPEDGSSMQGQYMPPEQYAPEQPQPMQESYAPQEQYMPEQPQSMQEQYASQEQSQPMQEQYAPQEQYVPEQPQPMQESYAPQEKYVPEQSQPMQEPYAPQGQYVPEQSQPMQESYAPQAQYMPKQPQAAPLTEEQAKKKEYDRMLAQELDGQISLSLPEDNLVDRQLTGQIHIDEVLKEWESKKQDSNQKRKEDAKRKALDQTNDLLSQLVGIVPGVVAPVQAEAPKAEIPQEKIATEPIKSPVSEMEHSQEPKEESPAEEVHNKVTEVTGSVIKTAFDAEDKQRALEVTGKIPDFILPSRKTDTTDDKTKPAYTVAEPEPPVYSPPIKQPEPMAYEQPAEQQEPITYRQPTEQSQPMVYEQPAEQPESITYEPPTEQPEAITYEQPIEQPEAITYEQPIEQPNDPVDDGIEEIEEIQQPEEIYEQENPVMVQEEVPVAEPAVEEVKELEPEPKQESEEEPEEEPEDDLEEIRDKSDKKTKKGLPSYMTLDGDPKSKRDFDEEEKRIFASFDGIEVVKAQIVDLMEDISMDGKVGNVVLMGSLESGRKGLAIDIVRAMQIIDSRFSGKVAKITGKALNKKDIPITLGKLAGGALVIEEAGEITKDNMQIITNTLQKEIENIVVVLEDTKEKLQPHLDHTKAMKKVFNAVIDIPEYSNDDLVSYAKGYAKSLEYAIDEMGVLALYTRIGELQTLDHIVSLEEVREIVDGAIKHVDRKNMSHFMDILFAKRYDDDDFIILREKDFITKK